MGLCASAPARAPDSTDETLSEATSTPAPISAEKKKAAADDVKEAKFAAAQAEAAAAATKASEESEREAAAAIAVEQLRINRAPEAKTRKRGARHKERNAREAGETACVARGAFTDMKLSLQSHTTTRISHTLGTPLVITFGAPPMVDSTARMWRRQVVVEREDGIVTYAACPGARVMVDQRPTANKVRLVCGFPARPGEFELLVYCKPHKEMQKQEEEELEASGNNGGTLVLRYEIVVSDGDDDNDANSRASPAAAASAPPPSPKKKKRARPSRLGKKITARAGSFGSEQRTTSLSSSELWKGPVVSPRGRKDESKVAIANDALLKSIAPRNVPTQFEEDGATAKEEEEDKEASNPMFKMAAVAGFGHKMKKRASTAKEGVTAKKRLQMETYAGRAPVMSAHFGACRMALQSHPKLLITYGGGGGAAIEKGSGRMHQGDKKESETGKKVGAVEEEAELSNKPSSADSPLLMTLGMPPNIDPVAVLKKWTANGMRLVDIKNGKDVDGRRRGVVVDTRPKSHKLRLLVWFPVPGMYEVDIHCCDGQAMGVNESKKKGGVGAVAKLAVTYVIDVKEATRPGALDDGRSAAQKRSLRVRDVKSKKGVHSPLGSPRLKKSSGKAATGKKMAKRSDSFTFRAW